MTARNSRARLDACIDAIEGGYEFMLAYAAQGKRTDRNAPGESGPRLRLEAMVDALTELGALARAVAADADTAAIGECEAFFDAIERDAAVATAAIRLVLGRPDIGSQLIDNLNASIHLRAVLTDIFLLDEAFEAKS